RGEGARKPDRRTALAETPSLAGAGVERLREADLKLLLVTNVHDPDDLRPVNGCLRLQPRVGDFFLAVRSDGRLGANFLPSLAQGLLSPFPGAGEDLGAGVRRGADGADLALVARVLKAAQGNRQISRNVDLFLVRLGLLVNLHRVLGCRRALGG